MYIFTGIGAMQVELFVYIDLWYIYKNRNDASLIVCTYIHRIGMMDAVIIAKKSCSLD